MENAIELRKNSLPATAVLWVLKLAIAGLFAMAGYSKLAGAEQMVGLFDMIGLGQWFRYFTGATELISAVLLLIPAMAGFGALLASATMVGAVLTHLTVIHSSPAVPGALLVAALIVLFSNRAQVLRVFGK